MMTDADKSTKTTPDEANADSAPNGAPDLTSAGADDAPASASAEPALDPMSQLAKERDEAKAAVEEYKDMAYRKAAELENTRRRMQKQIDQARLYGMEDLFRDLLPVLDDLDRALDHARSGDGTAPAEGSNALTVFIEGVLLVQRKFLSSIDRYGVKPFDAKGQPFNPTLHEAISQVETDEAPPGTVVSEFARGYMLQDRVLRPALVAVARGSQGTDGAN